LREPLSRQPPLNSSTRSARSRFAKQLPLDCWGPTFDMSGTWKRAQPAVRCPLDGGVGHQPALGALTFELRHLPLLMVRRTLPAQLFADNPDSYRLGRSLLAFSDRQAPQARPLGFAVCRLKLHRPAVACDPARTAARDAPRAHADLCTSICAGNLPVDSDARSVRGTSVKPLPFDCWGPTLELSGSF
jgi:hypothetical protein